MAQMGSVDAVRLHCRQGSFTELEECTTFITSGEQTSLGINMTSS